MGVWDETTPAGTDLVSAGDDRIRELKVALGEALSHENSTFPGATPAATPIFIPGFSRDTTANRPTGDSLVTGRFFVNTSQDSIEWYDGAAWQYAGANFAAGTAMVFYNTNAPTGWTAVAINDKFLRVVSGTGGVTAGSVAASTSLAHTHTVDAHTHSTPNHTHYMDVTGSSTNTVLSSRNVMVNQAGAPAHNPFSGTPTGGSGTAYQMSNQTVSEGSGTSGAASASGTDSQLGAFAYADVLIATRDAVA